MARRRFQRGTLRKRGKRNPVWELQWREDYIKPDGSIGRRLVTRIIGTCADMTKRQAQKAADEILRPLNLGKLRPESAMTVAEFVDRYFIPNAFPALKISTQRRYRQTLNYHLLPAFGSTRLMDLTAVAVQRFVLDKMAAGLGWEAANHLRNLISKLFTTAKRWGLFAGENPASAVELPEKTPVREKHALNAEQTRAVLAALREPARTMVMLAAQTGMRVGEILALRWEDVDFTAGTIHVRRNCYRGVMGTPKNKKQRVLPLPRPLARALQDRRLTDCGLIFSTAKGTPLDYGNLLHRFLKPAGARVGMPWLSWHVLRRSLATYLGQRGFVLEAKAQLGHARLSTTEQYMDHSTAAQRKAVAEFADQLMANDGEFAKTRTGSDVPIQQIQ